MIKMKEMDRIENIFDKTLVKYDELNTFRHEENN